MIVSLPYHIIHQLANIKARGENWRKRKREEVLTLSCSRQGVGDGQIEMSCTEFILSLILIHLCVCHHQMSAAPQKDQFGFIWLLHRSDEHHLHPIPSSVCWNWRVEETLCLCPLADDRCQQLCRKSSRRIWDVMFCLKVQIGRLRCATMSFYFIWGRAGGGFIWIVGWNIVHSGVGSQCCERPPVFNVASVRIMGGPALTAAPQLSWLSVFMSAGCHRTRALCFQPYIKLSLRVLDRRSSGGCGVLRTGKCRHIRDGNPG